MVNYTEEQKTVIEKIFESSAICVNALAGTGKTTTCFGVIQEAIKKGYRVLYLVFNKSMQIEAERRAKNIGINGSLDIKTVHALAYKYLVRTGYFKDRIVNNIRVKEVADAFNKSFDYDRYFFLLKIFNEFLYSDYLIENIDVFLRKLESENSFYEEIINRYAIIPNELIYLYGLIEDGELPCPHDFYLKKFIDALIKKQIYCKYDLVILDESQDANPCFASLLKNIKTSHLLMVGDRHQWIYSFRGSVNLMEKFDNVEKLYLTHTFRFDDIIANLANKVLLVKGEKHLLKSKKAKSAYKNRAIISRTNSELLQYYLSMSDTLKKLVFFERGIEEIIKLPLTIAIILEKKHPKEFCERNSLQVSKVIDESFYKLFRDPVDLKLYIKELESLNQKGDISSTETDTVSAFKIADTYTAKGLTKLIHKYYANIESDNDDENKIYMSTAHSCKGQEYKNVTLLDDFKQYLKDEEFSLIENKNQTFEEGFKEILRDRLRANLPELNLLYVALTRASDSLEYSYSVYKNIKTFNFCIENGITTKTKMGEK